MLAMLGPGYVNASFPGSAPHIVLGFVSAILAGYLLGSLNFGVIISKTFFHDDVRKYGSGGAGATNMLRTYGKFPAAMTFLLDGLKAVAAVFIGALILGHNSAFAGSYIGGLACLVGHAFPVYYGFKGGKSIAAGFFMVLCTSPLVAVICFGLFLIIVVITRFVSLGSIAGALLYPVLLFIMTGAGLQIAVALTITAFIIYLHRKNIKRLLNGSENKIDFKNTKKIVSG